MIRVSRSDLQQLADQKTLDKMRACVYPYPTKKELVQQVHQQLEWETYKQDVLLHLQEKAAEKSFELSLRD